jgi:hypothetical protein
MQDASYNGWKNYATWGVALVLDNDEGTYLHVRELLEGIAADAPLGDPVVSREDYIRYTLADRIKDYTEDLCGLEDEPGPSLMARQVIQAGLAEVEWADIASHVLDCEWQS